ncbi:MAG: cupin domain-containing protein [Alphaproteobacteria bacterium]
MIRALAKIVAGGLFLALLSGPEAKADNHSITVTVIDLGNPSESVIGQGLSNPAGEPVFKALKIIIPPGTTSSLHQHEANSFAYVLEGTLEVDYGSKGKKRFGPGQGCLEAVNFCHKGRAVSEAPVMVIVLYLGTPSLKNTVACEE